MNKVALVAHSKKSLDGGLPELRLELKRRGHDDLCWLEVQKSKQVPDAVRKALRDKPDLLLVWGGDGTVQRTIDTLVRKGVGPVPMAVLPAGTSNLFAHNLGIPIDLVQALDVAFAGDRRTIDVGSLNGERFGVMAGVGFDARMIGDASRSIKDRLGRAAYVYTGVKNLRRAADRVRIEVDGERWYDGRASSVLLANVGELFGQITLFDEADPADGHLDIGVLHAESLGEWTRLAGRALTGTVDRSPLLTTRPARRVDIWLNRRTAYELDGGARGTAKRIKVRVKPHALTVCVPAATSDGAGGVS